MRPEDQIKGIQGNTSELTRKIKRRAKMVRNGMHEPANMEEVLETLGLLDRLCDVLLGKK